MDDGAPEDEDASTGPMSNFETKRHQEAQGEPEDGTVRLIC